MPAKNTTPASADLKRLIREHEELEEKLYTALISDHIPKGTDIMSELWDYAEQMSGWMPGNDEGDDYYDD